MKFIIGFKPTILTGSGTMRQAEERVCNPVNQCFSYTSFGHGWGNSKYVFGYNIEIFKRGKHRHNKHYVIYKYIFPKEVFELLNVEIHQGSRTFKVVPKKKL